MKNLIIAVTLSITVLFAVDAMATKPCPPGQSKKGWKCMPDNPPTDQTPGNTTLTNTNDINNKVMNNILNAPRNTVVGVNKNTNLNLNGNSNANTNDNTNNNKNVNRNDISNTNTNTNNNSNKNTNANDNKSTAVQGQGQAQGQVLVNAPTTINFSHELVGLDRTSSEAKDHSGAGDAKIKSNVDSMISRISLKSAKKLGKNTTDFEKFTDLLFENDFVTSAIIKGNKGDFMGTITLISDGDDATLGGLQGRAYVAAMKAGATHYLLSSTSGKHVQGSSAGIDFGSAASVVVKSDGSALISPGATLGYSTSWSSNEWRPAVVIHLFFDRTMKITPVK